jgi:hypothetical protein
MEILVRSGLAQAIARHEELGAVQLFSGVARVDPREVDDQHVRRPARSWTHGVDLEHAAVRRGERTVPGQVRRIRGVCLHPHLTADAMRRADAANQDKRRVLLGPPLLVFPAGHRTASARSGAG